MLGMNKSDLSLAGTDGGAIKDLPPAGVCWGQEVREVLGTTRRTPPTKVVS